MISTSFPVPRVFHLANDVYPVPYSKLIEILKKRFLMNQAVSRIFMQNICM